MVVDGEGNSLVEEGEWEGGGGLELRWDICRGEAHLSWCQGGEDFYVFVGEDVRGSPWGVVPPWEDKEAEEGGLGESYAADSRACRTACLMSAAMYSGFATHDPVHR